MWALTSYFNPIGYRQRLANYHIFRSRLTVPLVAVELGFSRAFDLREGDAEVLIQLRGGDVLWQKERLLNVALQALPAECDQVAWLDCDVVFEASDWADRASHLLRRFALLHLFRKRVNLECAVRTPDQIPLAPVASVAMSLPYKMVHGCVMSDDFRSPDAPLRRGTTVGLAWAARREILEGHGLYDACIIGTGDRAIACAAYGRFEDAMHATSMCEPGARHYLQWARPFFERVGGNVGHVEGTAVHLWHGNLANRRYQQRHEDLRAFGFDPFIDIAVDAQGCWRWNSDKPAMHAHVRRYFEDRHEDG